jgi:hypothetical protein
MPAAVATMPGVVLTPARALCRRAIAASLAALAFLALVPGATATADRINRADDSDIDAAAIELAEKYRPVIGIQRQAKPCGPGEPYLPTDALAIVERPDVVLRDRGGSVLLSAPTADDLAAADNSTNIDFPGNALAPECTFERWFRAAGPPPPAVYGRVLIDPDQPEFTVLQYWFFWIYNDWNNRHEGDWEMMQIVFEAPSAAEALTTEPSDVVLSQHEGAERSPWEDVARVDGRPVVYPAGGSHATFFEQDRFLGKSAEAGFGCDDTRAPSTMLDPTVIMMPAVVDPDGEFGWLAWEGRWGERRPSFNNGPQGPLSKRQWDEPVGWMDDIARTHSLRAPPFGNDVTDFFCTATERVSMILLKAFDNPFVVGGSLVLLVAVGVGLSRRTRWTPVVARPVAGRRRTGQIVRSAARLLITERRRFMPVAALIVISGLVAAVVRELLLRIPAFDDTDLLFSGDPIGRAMLALVTGSLVTVPVGIAAVAIGAAIASDLDRVSEPQRLVDLLRHRGLGPVIALIVLMLILAGPVTFLLGAYLVARWGAAPALALEGDGIRGSLRDSTLLTKGHRWRTGGLVLGASTFASLIGPLLGALVLIATGASFGLVNVLAACVTAVMLPWLSIVLVMLHRDLADRHLAATVTVGDEA